jgi:hypothetical protein
MKALAPGPGPGVSGSTNRTNRHAQQPTRGGVRTLTRPEPASSGGTEAASPRFAGMTSAPKSKPASAKFRYWRVSVPGGKRPEYVGIVEAPDRQSAEATAVKRFRLTDEERERLVVRTRG